MGETKARSIQYYWWCCGWCCTVSENPTLSDVYISDEEGPAEPIQQSPKVSQPQMTVNNKQAAMQPAVTSRTTSSHKKNEPLPPIPQHHYDQAARQIQQSRHVVPASSHDDVKMEWVICVICIFIIILHWACPGGAVGSVAVRAACLGSFPDPDRLLDLPGFPMSFSFQNFGTWPIYDMIFFRYMISKN